MAGLLDWMATPQGQGLLSGIASYAMNARRGTPVNNLGRGLAGGVAGYVNANDQLRQDEENKFLKEYRQMQMDQMRQTMERQNAIREASGTAYKGAYKPPVAAQPAMTTFAPTIGDDSPLLGGMTAAMGGNFDDQPLIGNQQSVKLPERAAQPGGFDPEAYRKNMFGSLAERGFVDEAMKFAPGEAEKPQLVTVYENGQPVQKWLRPGEAEGVQVGKGRPEEVKAPPLRTRVQGGSEIQEEFVDGQWKQIGAGPRWNPAPATVVNNFGPKEVFKNERELRNDFQGLPTTKAFREVQASYDQIKYALKNPSAANDLTAATKFMKLLDPGSVVRESELGMAMAATGQLDRMGNYYNMLKTGQKLTPSQRADFYKSAQGLYEAASNRYNQSADEYRGIAQDYQLNPDRIAKPAALEKEPAKPAVQPPAAAVNMLRMNPRLKADFDAKYGQGAADRYLKR